MLIGYVRISTDGDRQKPDSQIEELIKYGVDKSNIYIDKMSGSTKERPGFKAAMNALKPGDSLIVARIDRMGRSLSHLLEILERLNEMQISFKSLAESALDTSTSVGQLMFALIAAFAQYERSLIRERVNSGLSAARNKGVKLGRREVVTKEQLDSVEKNIAAGISVSEACRLCGLNRTTYLGYKKRKNA